MLNGAQAVMQSLYFRQQVEDKPWVEVSQGYCPEMFGGTVFNPLETLRLMCFGDDDMSISPEDAARVCGVDAGDFSDNVPALSIDEVERALGRLALAHLATLRNNWRTDAGCGDRESVLSAPEAFRLILESNNKARTQ